MIYRKIDYLINNFKKNQDNFSYVSNHWQKIKKRKYTLKKLLNFKNTDLIKGLSVSGKKNNLTNEDLNVYSHKYFYKNFLKKNLKKNIKVLEIGQGYGELASILLKKKEIKQYFFIDLPEHNLLTQINLIKYYKDFSFNEEFKKINFLTFKQLKFLKKEKFDLIISTRVFMELRKKTLITYMKFINSNINNNGLFLLTSYINNNVNNNKEKFNILDYNFSNNWTGKIINSNILKNEVIFFLKKTDYFSFFEIKVKLYYYKEFLMNLKKICIRKISSVFY